MRDGSEDTDSDDTDGTSGELVGSPLDTAGIIGAASARLDTSSHPRWV